MKIKINDQFELKLQNSKNKYIMSNSGDLYLISDFTVVEEDLTVTKGVFYKTTEVFRQKYLTAIDINSYHHTGKFRGLLTDEAAAMFVQHYDFYHMRQKWEDFKDMLKAFDLVVACAPEDNDELLIRKAAEDHLKEYFKDIPGEYTKDDVLNFTVNFFQKK